VIPIAGSAPPQDRLVVALDGGDGEEALERARQLAGLAGYGKIGIGHLPWNPIRMAHRIRALGLGVFLDMKLFDIGSTVHRAVSAIIEQAEPDLLTVHGDPHVVEAARRAAEGAATRVLAVTLLTSLGEPELERMMIRSGRLADIVVERGRRALAAGADGLVAAPPDVARLRALPQCRNRLLATPGVRLAPVQDDDQARVSSPSEALRQGADLLVVGRPIVGAADPADAARRFLADMDSAFG